MKKGIHLQYVKSRDGVVKLAELFLTLLAFLCSVCAWSSHAFRVDQEPSMLYYNLYGYRSAIWNDIATSVAFIITAVLLILHESGVTEKFDLCPWNTLETVYCLAISACLVIAGGVMIPQLGDQTRSAAAFFSFAAALSYAVDAFLRLLSICCRKLLPSATNEMPRSPAAPSNFVNSHSSQSHNDSKDIEKRPQNRRF